MPRKVSDLLDLSPHVLADRFARAVAARTDELFIVHPDNSGHWAHWSNNAVPSAPYAVHLADVRGFRTLALDFDGTNAERDAQQAASLLQRAGVRNVRTRSGPAGGQHILATFDVPIPPSAMARMARALGRMFVSLDSGKLRNAESGAIRPPLSPHRVAGRSEPIGDMTEDLIILEKENPPEAWRRLADLAHVPLLTPRMEYLLLYGRGPHPYRSRSEIVHAIALAHANAGSTLDHLLDDLLDPLNAAGNKVREQRNPGRYVQRSWARASERVKRFPMILDRPQALALLDRIRATIDAAPWPGLAASTDYAIMQAHLAIAERAGGPEYHASVREVAERSGVHLRTVIRHHKRLLRSGWLRRRGLRYPRLATRWRLAPRSTAWSS